MKTIGVLGGLGPQATIDFEARLHKVAQSLIPPQGNSGYPPMVVYYYRHPPLLLNEDSSPQLPMQPDPRFLEAARQVGSLADFLVITANAPHLFLEQIEQAAQCQVVSMVEQTLEAIRHRQWRKVGVLGFGDPLVYTNPLGKLKIACETLEADRRAPLDEAIMKLMEGRNNAASTASAREALHTLRARKVEGIVLGCTEIPILLQEMAHEPDLLNPAQLLAEAAVRFSLT